jgi:ATP-dependent RNA helicase DeaD
LSKFADLALREPTRAALAQMGFENPTPIQSQAIPPLLDGRDLIAEAPTGSGKTLAFGLPLAERVDPRRREVQALVLVPTRELATQVEQVLGALGRHHGFRTLVVCGGRSAVTQTQALRAGAQVVVGTPGRVLDLLQCGALRLGGVRYLVLDEADEMLDRGFAPDVERILARAPANRQTALLSATVPDWVRSTAAHHLQNPATVRDVPPPAAAPAIEHQVYEVQDAERLPALRTLLDDRGAGMTLVFGRTKHGVKALCRRLEALGYPVAALQGNLSQNARDRVMADVRAGQVPILIATNVAARGIDVDHIERVINYELPETPELFTHRVGRTGRMGRHGVAITLLGPTDFDRWKRFERSLGRALPRTRWSAVAGTSPHAATAAPARQPAGSQGASAARQPSRSQGASTVRQSAAVRSAPAAPRPSAGTPAGRQPQRVPASTGAYGRPRLSGADTGRQPAAASVASGARHGQPSEPTRALVSATPAGARGGQAPGGQGAGARRRSRWRRGARG